MESFHAAEFGWLLGFRLAGLFDIENSQNGTVSPQLNARAGANFNWSSHSFAFDERTEPRIYVGHEPPAILQSKFDMLARHHRPFLLLKEIMAGGWIATSQDDIAGERSFTD